MDTNVSLHVYDLSNGIAKTLSGGKIEGVWHSTIVVHSREYYISGGICYDVPHKTKYGTPINIVELGYTDKNLLELEEFINSLKTDHSAERYCMISNNCNHFTEKVAVFLTGNSIPEYIRSAPTDILAVLSGK